METTIAQDLIARFCLVETWNQGKRGVRPALRKLTASELELVRANLPEILAELDRREAARKAAQEIETQRKAAELAALQAGETPITVSWADGEYLSGHIVHGQEAKLLEKLGLASWVSGWGYLVNDTVVEALGKEFSYPDAAAYAQPAIDAKAAKIAKAETDRAAKFVQARETGQRVLLESYADECNDRNEECSMDMVSVYAMPDGTTKTVRSHTW